MAFVTARPTKIIRPRAAADPYSRKLRAERDPQIDPYQFPTGSLAGLGDLGDGTGIDFLDSNVKAIRAQLDEASLAARITAVCAIVSGIASVFLLVRTGGRGR
jgi:hypothetical protein